MYAVGSTFARVPLASFSNVTTWILMKFRAMIGIDKIVSVGIAGKNDPIRIISKENFRIRMINYLKIESMDFARFLRETRGDRVDGFLLDSTVKITGKPDEGIVSHTRFDEIYVSTRWQRAD